MQELRETLLQNGRSLDVLLGSLVCDRKHPKSSLPVTKAQIKDDDVHPLA